MATLDEEEPWEGKRIPDPNYRPGTVGVNQFGQRQVPKATDSYIDKMDQEEGVFSKDFFKHPKIKEMTDNAKDVVRQIMRNYNSGDELTRKMVQEFERDERKQGFEWQSGMRMNAETAWELFYHAHQKYLGSKLQNEDKPPSKEDEALYNQQYGFDMGGRNLFDFQKLIDAGKLKPRGVD